MTDYVGSDAPIDAPVNSIWVPGPTWASTVEIDPNITFIPYQNRVFDSVAGSFVTWISPDAPDITGTTYPGPGTFGVNTTDFVYKILG